MSEESIVAILVAVIASGSVSSLTAFLLKRLYERSHGSPRQKALETGVQALLFEKLAKLHQTMIERGGWSPDSEKQLADRIYQAYHDLGGNGVGTALHADILAAHSQPSNTESERK